MKKSVAVILLGLALSASAWAAEIVMKTESWANNDDEFAKFDERIASMNPRNLLARRGVKIAENKDIGLQSIRYMTDGNAGERCHEGRAFVNGRPSVITFYLGEPKTIKEVGVFTFNLDARANQDYEVRFADNSAKPGVMPEFPAQPHLTTGDKVIGKNGGGFHSYFIEKGGGELFPGKADWVQFRIWRTYNVKAGTPAKARNTANSACAVIELEVLGDESDVVVPSKEELARREAIRKAPKRPAYEKKASWQETMVAAREAILEWECLQDRLAVPDSDVTIGPWYALGPIPAGSEVARKIERKRKIDLTKQYKLDGGRQIAWRKRDDLKDGEMIDLAARFKTGEGDVVFLCRSLSIATQFDRRNPFPIGVGIAAGWVKMIPKNLAVYAPRPACDPVPNQVTWNLTVKPGEYQVLARLPRPKDVKWALWFCPQPPIAHPGAGNTNSRIRRREALYNQLRRDFADPVSVEQITWEQLDSIWIKFRRRAMSRVDKLLTDWTPGKPDFLCGQYKAAAERRIADLENDTTDRRILDALERLKAQSSAKDVAALRKHYYTVATLQDAAAEAKRVESMRLAVEDQRDTFKERYPKAAEYLGRVEKLQHKAEAVLARVLSSGGEALKEVLDLRADIDAAGREILLANPLLNFEKLLVIKGGPGLASNWSGPNHLGREIQVLSPVRPDGKITTIFTCQTGSISNMELSFDAKKILFSDGKCIWEINADGTGLRQVSHAPEGVKHYDPCYLPNGRIMFVSTACEQAVPCTGQPDVGNMHVMDADGKNERRITFDQDHNWNPTVMNDGRVVFTRWEYNDTPHYFSRLLFRMNPDGTGQMEYYGSNSYWPNAMYWPRPIPGHPSKIVCVVSGHHGVPRMGELVIIDPARGQREAEGVIQRIPGRGKKVEPVIKDGLVSESWPRFATPWPLGDWRTGEGAGRYFLASCKMTPISSWGLYLVDVFDNMTPILMGGYSQPTPLVPRPTPPVIQDRIKPERKDALVYLVDIYRGNGLRGYPRGSIKALRLSSVHYRFSGYGGSPIACSYEGGWDVKVILGTVPVREDGSAYFRVPANTPIVVQPLDAEGKAQQQMRSWFAAMPGEVLSCVGCHETQNTATPDSNTIAMRHPPSEIKPWHGPMRGFSFERDVQPVLDRRCVGCHNGKPRQDGRTIPDFRAKRLHPDYDGMFSPAYMALHPFVRRAGYEADYHLPAPAEWEADTSQLVRMLKKGHNNVKLTPDEWDRIYTWIDLNIPYSPNWRESLRPPSDEQVARRVKFLKLYANVTYRFEDPLPLPEIARFEPPEPVKEKPASPPKLDGWPFGPEEAARRRKNAGISAKTLDLGGGVTMELVPIPAGKFVMGDPCGWPDERPQAIVTIDKPFWMGKFEVTNEQYAMFDPAHDSAYMDARGKDRFTRGYPVNDPKQPVIRVSWNEAMAFCRWLSEKTGRRCTLPTEAQWEYACRAGTAGPFSFGEKKPGMNNVANFSDSSLMRWNWGRVEPDYSDGALFSVPGGRYKPNAWGLYDMHGNVAEWCLTTYRPYPYDPADGRDDPDTPGRKVVRGGSWNDKMDYGRSGSRWRYAPYQPVYDVGFRVVCLPGGKGQPGAK